MCCGVPAPAWAWKPTCHVFFAELARKDARDGGLSLVTDTDPAGVLLVARGESPVPGDLTGEGTVSVLDVVSGMRLVAGLDEPTDAVVTAGDVHPTPGVGPKAGQPYGDGKVTVLDVLRLLRRTVGLEPQWP